MSKPTQRIVASVIFISCLGIAAQVNASDSPTVIINNNAAPAPAPAPSNNNNNQSSNNSTADSNDLRGGTYYQTNPNGGTDTIYTTGDKQPYIVDNNSNNNIGTPIVQPFIYGPNEPRPPHR